MAMRLRHAPRRGTTLVECAVIYPALLLLLFGLIIGALGIFRYQETASLAREAARWAAVHGTRYAKDAGVAAPTGDDIYNQVVVSRAVALDLSRLSYSVTWDSSNDPFHAVLVNGNVVPVTNTVTVQLTYRWIPEAFLGGVTFSSTSVMPMSY
jgi:Flp pilus assembly protein TadG